MSVHFKRILVPTDYSDTGAEALDHARALATAFDAQVFCIHVVDEAYQYWSSMGPETIPIGPPIEDLIALGQSRMTKFVAQHLANLSRPPISTVVMGRPFAEIIKYARDNAVDVIVMGTHGRGALAHVLLGSTTEKVVRKASCAVLTVRSGSHKFEMP